MLPLSTTDSSRWWSKLRDLGSVSGLTGQAPVKDRLRWECWETSSVDNREAKSSGSLAGDALHAGKFWIIHRPQNLISKKFYHMS